MNSRRSTCAFACLLLTLPCVAAAEFSGYLVLTTDYVHRGVTYSDGHGAVQLDLDWSFDSGFYAGAWGSTIDIANGPQIQRDTQVNYYLGYAHALDDRWTVGANLVAYRFPGTVGRFEYDYEELTLSVNWADRVWLEYSYTDDLYRTDLAASNVLVYGEYPGWLGTFVSAGVGYYDPAELTGMGYGYWQAGVSRTFGRLDFDLRFHDTNRYVPIVSSPARSGSRVSLSARLSF